MRQNCSRSTAQRAGTAQVQLEVSHGVDETSIRLVGMHRLLWHYCCNSFLQERPDTVSFWRACACVQCRVLGVVTAMETFAGQAYGAGAYASLGEMLQRGLAISFLCCCAVVLLWQWCAPVLIASGQVGRPRPVVHRNIMTVQMHGCDKQVWTRVRDLDRLQRHRQCHCVDCRPTAWLTRFSCLYVHPLTLCSRSRHLYCRTPT